MKEQSQFKIEKYILVFDDVKKRRGVRLSLKINIFLSSHSNHRHI